MGWAKVDYGFFRNPKVVGISKDAKFLYIAGLCYCGENLTDGRIPASAVRILSAEIEARNPLGSARELVRVGLWKSSNDAEFWVNDYLEFNESSDERRAKRDGAKERMKRVRSHDVRANNPRTSDEVRTKLHQQEEEVEEELTDVPNGTSGAEALDGIPAAPSDDDRTEPEPEPEPAWKPSGPDQQLVAWWADYSGAGMPKMFSSAVGAAAHLRKAGLDPADAPALFDYCAAFQQGVTLQKMAGQYDAWRASLATPKSTGPRRSGQPVSTPPPPPRGEIPQTDDDIERLNARFMAGSRGGA